MSVCGFIVGIIVILNLYTSILDDLKQHKIFSFLDDSFSLLMVVFCVTVQIWAIHFTTGWEKYERKFCLRFGTFDYQAEMNVRYKFKGNFQRSLVNDKMNDIGIQGFSNKLKRVLINVVFVIFCLLCLITSLFLLFLKRERYKQVYGEDAAAASKAYEESSAIM